MLCSSHLGHQISLVDATLIYKVALRAGQREKGLVGGMTMLGADGLPERGSEVGLWVYLSLGTSPNTCPGLDTSLVPIKAGPSFNQNLSSFCQLVQGSCGLRTNA